jgi:hypothetical protein
MLGSGSIYHDACSSGSLRGADAWPAAGPLKVGGGHMPGERLQLTTLNESHHATAKTRAGLAGANHPGRTQHGVHHDAHCRYADMEQLTRTMEGGGGQFTDGRAITARQRGGEPGRTVGFFDDEAAASGHFRRQFMGAGVKCFRGYLAQGCDSKPARALLALGAALGISGGG